MNRLSLVFLTLLIVSPFGLATPMLRTGSFTLSANSSNLKTIMDCTEGRVVEVSFTATQAPVEFFVVHSDDWDLSGTPDISACEFYITARSATHQFVLDRGGTWYLYFKNGPTSQEVTWTWTEYTQQSWAIRQFTTWTMISAVVVGAVLIMFWYWRSRR